MKKAIENSENQSDEKHKKYLGFNVPDNYFENSKENILQNIYSKKNNKMYVLSTYRKLSIAASIILLFSAGLYLWKHQSSNDNQIVAASELYANSEIDSNNIILNSLFVDDADVLSYINSSVTNSFVYEDNKYKEEYFFNTIFIDNSELDEYINKVFLQ